MADPRTKLRDLALGFPETHEAFPWDERVVKVRGRVFVFLGRRDGTDEPMITVKLVESHGHALSVEGARPTGYGLGKSGWVTVPVADVALDDASGLGGGELPHRRTQASRRHARRRPLAGTLLPRFSRSDTVSVAVGA